MCSDKIPILNKFGLKRYRDKKSEVCVKNLVPF